MRRYWERITYPNDGTSTQSLHGYNGRRFRRLGTFRAGALAGLGCIFPVLDCQVEHLRLQLQCQLLEAVSDAVLEVIKTMKGRLTFV
jgi:hypothetical protein